jgi:predicted metal-dependent hydrolase
MHPTVSREHFAIEHSHGKYFVVDRESGNGTIVNGSRVTWAELKDGDRIQAGPFVLLAELGVRNPESEESVFESALGVRTADEDADSAFTDEHARIYPREYLAGIRHFNAGRFFEAHEIWEEVWLRSSDETKVFYQMLIQAAVGLYHHEKGNSRGASGMYAAVIEKLARLPAVFMSLDLRGFADAWRSFFTPRSPESDSSIRTALRIELLPIDF